MRLQDMPILDRMYPTSKFVVESSWGPKEAQISAEGFRQLSGFKRFKLQSGQRTQTPPGGEKWDIPKLFGHLALPYPKVWVEWDNVREAEDPRLASIWMALACVEFRYAEEFFASVTGGSIRGLLDGFVPENGSWIGFSFLMLNGVPWLAGVPLFVLLNEDKMVKGVSGVDVRSGKAGQDQWSEIVDLVWDGLSAIGWLNCRNIGTEEVNRSGNIKRRKPNRNKATSLNFHTINLPGTPSTPSGEPGNKTGNTALHMARGHFKTFTEDAPLMGKHVGTYWWGWQVRGNPERGQTVTDYKISA